MENVLLIYEFLVVFELKELWNIIPTVFQIGQIW